MPGSKGGAEGFGAGWTADLGWHLAGSLDTRARRFSLHMGPKSGTHKSWPFHWTGIVAIDLDLRPDHPPGSLRARYEACLGVLDAVPLVVRSPDEGCTSTSRWWSRCPRQV
jgi:hypothetical protein